MRSEARWRYTYGVRMVAYPGGLLTHWLREISPRGAIFLDVPDPVWVAPTTNCGLPPPYSSAFLPDGRRPGTCPMCFDRWLYWSDAPKALRPPPMLPPVVQRVLPLMRQVTAEGA